MSAEECGLELRRLMHIKIAFAAKSGGGIVWPVDVGRGPYGVRKVFSAKSGTFEFDGDGPLSGFSGIVVPGPADFCIRDSIDDPKYLCIDVRGLLYVQSEAKPFAIYMHYASTVAFTQAIIDQILSRGLPRPESSFITNPRFEVGAPSDPNVVLDPEVYRLNTMSTVAHASLTLLGIDQVVYEICNPTATPA